MEPTNSLHCTFDGCGREHHARGLCKSHYNQQIAGRPLIALRAVPLTPIDRLQANVEVTAGCWEWQRSVDKDGYGRFYLEGRSRSAHRVAYELLVGQVEEGFEVDHLCHNRRCVNPSHLEAVTKAENIRRMHVHQGR